MRPSGRDAAAYGFALSGFGLALDAVALEERVGQGTSGEVFRARVKATGAPLAAKIYPLRSADAAFRPRERFWRECRILARLKHPAFPALHGCGELKDGQGYALMEWIEGPPLSRFRNATAGEVFRLAHGIASGLAELHRAGFVHRDVAFDNVLVEERRSGLYPRIIDFGVAKDLADDVELTQAGNFLGRLEFAAPEALSEEGAGSLDPKGDVFSMGALLYEWLSGQPPFPGETPQKILKSRRKGSPPALVVAKGRGPVDESAAPFVASLLELDPAQRPDSAAMVRGLLRLRRLHPPARIATPAARSLLAVGGDGAYRLAARTFPGVLAPPRMREMELPQGAEIAALAPEPAGAALAEIAPPDVPSAPQRDTAAQGRWVLAAGIAAFVLACVAAACLVLRG